MSIPQLNKQLYIRTEMPSDINFILNSWLKSYRNSKKTKKMTNDEYYTKQSKLIFELLQSSQIRVACNPEDIKQIFGYIVYEVSGVVHFAYTKQVYRKFGVLKALLVQANLYNKPIVCTHWLSKCKEFKWKGVNLNAA